jgi:MoxR-like ATPase
LPEAQLDRFLLRVSLGYPGLEDEIEILDRQQFRHPVFELGQVASVEDVIQAQEAIKAVFIAPQVKEYLVEINRATRSHPEVYLGASPRGSLGLYRTSQALAAIRGRDFVLPDDVKSLVGPVLAHRIILGPGARLRELNAREVVQQVLGTVTVPGGEFNP